MSARGTGRWLAALAAVLLTAPAGSAVAAVPPAAHARLNASTPAAGSVVPQAPGAVVLSFNRDIAPPATVVVTGPDGGRVGTAEPAVRGRDVSAPITAEQQGTYTVAFRAVSVDGHPITGRFTFSVGRRSAPPDAVGPVAGGRSWWPWVGGLGLAGGVVVGLARRRSRRATGDVRIR